MTKKNSAQSIQKTTTSSSSFIRKFFIGGAIFGLGLSAAYYAWLENNANAALTDQIENISQCQSSNNAGFFSYNFDKRPATLYERIEATTKSVSIYVREDFRGMGVSKDSKFRTLDSDFLVNSLGNKALRPKDCDPDLEFGHADDAHHEEWHSSQTDIMENAHRHFHLVYEDSEKNIPEGTLKCLLENVGKFEEQHGFCLDSKTDCLIDKLSSNAAAKAYDKYIEASNHPSCLKR